MIGSVGGSGSVSSSPEIYPLKGKRVWVAGHSGMVGSALMRRLAREACELLTVSRSEVDLTRQEAVETWMEQARPQAIFLAAAKVGGILANSTYPATFIYDNIAITTNIIEAARKFRVEKLLNLGSSCIYPKLASQPMSESALLTGPLEETNEWYAIAKIAGIKLCQAYRSQYGCDFISAMPTNLFGPGDNFDLAASHVVPALLRKAHEAKMRGDKELVIWGTGTPRREFLYVDDCADALVYLMKVLLSGGACQCRVRNRPDNSRTGGAGGENSGLRGGDRRRPVQTRWHSAKAYGSRPAQVARVVTADWRDRGPGAHLQMVSRRDRIPARFSIEYAVTLGPVGRG